MSLCGDGQSYHIYWSSLFDYPVVIWDFYHSASRVRAKRLKIYHIKLKIHLRSTLIIQSSGLKQALIHAYMPMIWFRQYIYICHTLLHSYSLHSFTQCDCSFTFSPLNDFRVTHIYKRCRGSCRAHDK